MDRRRKVELFEEIRREYRFGVGTIQGVAKKLNTHRRMVRQALASADAAGMLLGRNEVVNQIFHRELGTLLAGA